MRQPHKHADLIKAWADGAKVEVLDDGGLWQTDHFPRFFPEWKYRIKPEDVVLSGWIERTGAGSQFFAFNHPNDNIKLTFDGETGELKAAEVLR